MQHALLLNGGPWLIRQLSKPAAFASVLGLFLVTIALVTPPFQGADEDRHCMRAYQLSELSALPTNENGQLGGTLPVAVVDSVRALFSRRGQPWDTELLAQELARRPAGSPRVFTSFPNTALYSPVAYAPQVVGIWIGRLLGQPPVVMQWLARLCSVATAVWGFVLAMRIAPCSCRYFSSPCSPSRPRSSPWTACSSVHRKLCSAVPSPVAAIRGSAWMARHALAPWGEPPARLRARRSGARHGTECPRNGNVSVDAPDRRVDAVRGDLRVRLRELVPGGAGMDQRASGAVFPAAGSL